MSALLRESLFSTVGFFLPEPRIAHSGRRHTQRTGHRWSGAVLPGATGTVTQTDTGLTRTEVTMGTGATACRNWRPAVSIEGRLIPLLAQTGIVLKRRVARRQRGSRRQSRRGRSRVEAPRAGDVQSAGISDVDGTTRSSRAPTAERRRTGDDRGRGAKPYVEQRALPELGCVRRRRQASRVQ